MLGRTASSERGFQDGDSLTRKISERASKLKAMRGGPNRASSAGARTKDTFSTTLRGCLTAQSCGFAVNADNVITAVRQDSPATARGCVNMHGMACVPYTRTGCEYQPPPDCAYTQDAGQLAHGASTYGTRTWACRPVPH